MKIFVINGVNLDMLGSREVGIYGHITQDELFDIIAGYAAQDLGGVEVECFQSNYEGAIVEKIHEARSGDGIVLNAGAFTHYSYAIRDALKCIDGVKAVEVHISNVNAREDFRKNSVISDVCVGTISGLGYSGYLYALEFLANSLNRE